MMLRVPYSRPVRYAMVLTHTVRSALDDINVDFTGVERSIADKIESMSTKIEALEARLAAYEDTINGSDQEPEKKKPRAKHGRKASTTGGRKAKK